MAIDFHAEAKRALESEMERLGVSFETLAELLQPTGTMENAGSVYAKIRRGTFQFAFFIRCIVAMQQYRQYYDGSVDRALKQFAITVPELEDALIKEGEATADLNRRRKSTDQLRARLPGQPKMKTGRPTKFGAGRTPVELSRLSGSAIAKRKSDDQARTAVGRKRMSKSEVPGAAPVAQKRAKRKNG